MALSPEEVAHLNRRVRRRAERAAEEMAFRDVSSEDYLKRLRAKRRPSRPFEVEDIPAAVEIEDEPFVPQYQSNRHSHPGRSFMQPRESAMRGTVRESSIPGSSTAKIRAVPNAPSTTTLTAKASVASRGTSWDRAQSRQDVVPSAQQPSTTTLDSGDLTSTPASLAPPISPRRSSLGAINPNKSVRRAASVAAIPSKPDSVENEMGRTSQQTRHTRSRSDQTAITPSDGPVTRGTLTRRSSLRMLKDKLRRVASAFELRPARRDDAETSGGVDLKHNKSTRSLLRYSGTRSRQQRRLDTVNEEA